MLAAIALGADGIYMGTRIIASKEAPVLEDYKKAILSAGPEDIVNTDMVDGFPGNFIRTPNLERMGIEPGFLESVLRQNKKFNRGLSLLRAGKALLGNPESKASYKNIFSAGHGVGLIEDIPTIAEIVGRTVEQFQAQKKNLP